MRAVPDDVVKIRTVLTPDDLRQAVEAGASFAFSSGAIPDLLAATAGAPIPFLPGVATASGLMAALARGFTTAKFFPATSAGGQPALRALSVPFPLARFCSTGGITESNAADWLAQPSPSAAPG